jgi:hypothetical protein
MSRPFKEVLKRKRGEFRFAYRCSRVIAAAMYVRSNTERNVGVLPQAIVNYSQITAIFPLFSLTPLTAPQ